MTTDLVDISQVLNQEIACRILRSLLASAIPLDSTKLASRLEVALDEITPMLASLVHCGVVECQGDSYQVSATGRASSDMWNAIRAYEEKRLRERAEQMKIDIPARFQTSEALREAIQRAREDLTKRGVK